MNGWSSPGIVRIAELIRRRTGLTFSETRRRDVEATFRRAMDRRGIADADRFVALLDEDAGVREALVAELTIGETYFGRVQEHFELLRWKLLPAMLAGRPADEPVRVWSAGCASGEEPYSVAMVFDELHALDRAAILGTDISRPRLDQARDATYSRWSLRGVPDDVIRRYFTQHGRSWELSPRIRRRVTFAFLNLAEDPFPSLSSGIWGMDVILCRNVLIYFDSPAVKRVARRLIASLSEDGWLLLGPADPGIADHVDCDVVMTDGGLAYRRKGRADTVDERRLPAVQEPAAAASPPEPTHVQDTVYVAPDVPPQPVAEASEVEGDGASDVAARVEDALLARDYDRVDALARAATAGDAAEERVWICWLRALANQGRLEEATEVATRALATGDAHAELLYLDAVVLLHAGHAAAAAARARQALYVDRTLVVAHITLADAQQRMGHAVDARRSLEAAAQLLDVLPADQPVPAADGEIAGRLAQLIRMRLRLLDEAA